MAVVFPYDQMYSGGGAAAEPFYQGGGVSLYNVPRLNAGETWQGPGVTLRSIPSGGGGVTGASGSGSPFGTVPTVPTNEFSIDTWLKDMEANKGRMTDYLRYINEQTNKQALANLTANLPGYTANQAALSSNIADALAGKVSQGTTNAIAQAAAERGLSVGAGSPNANTAMLRALGLTSEGLQAQGAQQFAQQISQTPVGKDIDWATFYNLANEERQWQYLKRVLESSPDPAAAAMYNMLMAQMGQRTGAGAVGGNTGGGFQGYTNQGNLWKNLMPGALNFGGSSPTVSRTTPNVGTPTGTSMAPGWAETWSDEGNYGSVGNVLNPYAGGALDLSMAPTDTSFLNYGAAYDPYAQYGGWDQYL